MSTKKKEKSEGYNTQAEVSRPITEEIGQRKPNKCGMAKQILPFTDQQAQAWVGIAMECNRGELFSNITSQNVKS